MRSGLFGGHKSGSLYGDHDLLDNYCTFGVEEANDAKNVWVSTACGKGYSRKNLSKLIL